MAPTVSALMSCCRRKAIMGDSASKGGVAAPPPFARVRLRGREFEDELAVDDLVEEHGRLLQLALVGELDQPGQALALGLVQLGDDGLAAERLGARHRLEYDLRLVVAIGRVGA